MTLEMIGCSPLQYQKRLRLYEAQRLMLAESLTATEAAYNVGYESITAYAEERNLSTSQLQTLYYELENMIPVIYNDFYAYKENLELFSPSMTNMRYLVIPKSVSQVTPEDYEKKTYTNIMTFGNAEFTDREGLLDYIRGFRDYLIYDSSNMDFQSSNMPISLSELSSYVKSYPPSVDGDYILAVAVDPQYMASDNLQLYKQQFDEIRPISRLAVYGVVLGGILYLITMVYLTMAAGRGSSDDGTIRLNRFDQIRTEAAVLLIAVPSLALLAGASVLSFSTLDKMEFALLGGGISLLFNLLFLSGYLSLVRRVRSRTLWSNSVLCRLTRGIARILRHWKATTKTLVSYGGFLTVNIVCMFLGSLGLFLAVVFDLIVGVVLMRQAVQRQQILDGIRKIAEGDLKHQIPVEKLGGDNRVLAETVNQIGEGLSAAVEKSIKDERLKSDLITNVSHDIKTPLTSIINYVDLLKREDIQNERAGNYIAILEDKALRLKHLTDDLVEASKISSGNVKRMKQSIKTAFLYSLIVAVCGTIVLYFSAAPIARGFISDAETVHYGQTFLKIICLACPTTAINFMVITVFQAIGKKVQPLFLSLLRKGSLDILFMLLLNNVMGISGIAWATPFADWVAFVISLVLIIPCI